MVSCPILVHAHTYGPCEAVRGFQVPSAQFGLHPFWGHRRDFPPAVWVRRPPLGAQPPLPSPALHPSHSRAPQFLLGPHGGDITTLPVPAPQKHQPFPAPPCPTLPKPSLTERWDFCELLGGFGFFLLLLILGFLLGFPGWRSEQGLLISGNKGPAAAYKQFRSGQVVGAVVPLGTLWLGQDFVTNFSAAEKLIWGKHLNMACLGAEPWQIGRAHV